MDEKFQPAMAAIESGRLDRLTRLIREDPTLATERSSEGHPTLLQCLVIDGQGVLKRAEMVNVLIEAGADVDEPLIAASGVDNLEVVEALIAAGGAINGNGNWSPIEEALYWNVERMIELLVLYEASVHNLRIAAGLGRAEQVRSYFNADGTLKPEAGVVHWPFGSLSEQYDPSDPVNIINNAFVYACAHGHVETAEALLEKGAEIDVMPPGFHYAATGLHYAALHGHRAMVECLVTRGADLNIRDRQVRTVPADWAQHGSHWPLASYLRSVGLEKN